MFALANMADGYVAVTGGYIDSKSQYLFSSHRYNVSADTWEDLPNMNVHREGHASCFLANRLYVFCGVNASKEPCNVVEYLDNATGNVSGNSWAQLQLDASVLAPRWLSAATPLNDTEIAIIGGLGIDEDI